LRRREQRDCRAAPEISNRFSLSNDALAVTPPERSYDAIATDANATLSRRHRSIVI
jgi:hypothetical protein